jgi:hypothetical protein
MTKIKKGLILVFRKESSEDFKQIARRINKIDSSIGVIGCPEVIDPRLITQEVLALPLLVIYLVNPPKQDVSHTAKKLAVKYLDKLSEQLHFKENNLPYLPISNFEWGMKLDKKVFGENVVLKPEKINSTGRDINRVPTELISKLKLEDFPSDHLIHKDKYLVQKYISTGQYPLHFRVLVFLGEIMYSIKSESMIETLQDNNNLKAILENTVASNLQGQRKVQLYKDENVNELALKVAATFPDNPLLGVDIIRDEKTDQLYVLEVNLGGNTWAFSSNIAKNVRLLLGKNAMVGQYRAWDKAANALIKATNEMAC